MMMIRIVFLLGLLGQAAPLSFSTDNIDGNDLKDLVFKNRLFVPYGPDLTTDPPQSSDEVWEGFGFGMGAVEHFAYDPYQRYVYAQSEGGPFVSVIDYSKFPAAITNLSIDLSSYDSDIKDVAVCPEEGLLFIAATDADKVLMYSTVKRNEKTRPNLLLEINAGARPDNLRANKDCTILAVANENDGDALAQGAIHLLSDFRKNGGPVVRKVSGNGVEASVCVRIHHSDLYLHFLRSPLIASVTTTFSNETFTCLLQRRLWNTGMTFRISEMTLIGRLFAPTTILVDSCSQSFNASVMMDGNST